MIQLGNPALQYVGLKNFTGELCIRRGVAAMITSTINKKSLFQKKLPSNDNGKRNVYYKPERCKWLHIPLTHTYGTFNSIYHSTNYSTNPVKGEARKPQSSSNFRKWEVLDLDEVTDFLTMENATNVVVIQPPKHLSYVDYFIVATGMSGRHIASMAMLLNKLYKQKRKDAQPFTNIEGMGVSDDWQCIDMGNMVVHLMLEEVREKYQLEKLWTLGPKNDDLMLEKPSVEEIVRRLTTQGLSLMSMNQDLVTAVGNEDDDFDDIEDVFGAEKEENTLSGGYNPIEKHFVKKEADSDEDAFIV